jgi:polar amino acid transport system permease protein
MSYEFIVDDAGPAPGYGQNMTTPAESAPVSPRVVRVRHYERWLAGAVLVAFLAFLAAAVADSSQIRFSAIRHYMFDPTIIAGVRRTAVLTALAMLIGIALGVVLASMRQSPNPLARWVALTYIWFMRGTPVLVQLVFWFNMSIIFPHLTLGIPGTALQLGSWETNAVVTPFVAALFGLGLNEGAWMAEVVRGGILGVDQGQVEAAHALGMTRGQTMRQIVLPQAVRIMVPPTGNEVLNVLKATALASVIAYPELLQTAQGIASGNFLVIELLVVASVWYLAITTVLSLIQSRLEHRFARSVGIEVADDDRHRLALWKTILRTARR